jgi:hypothetical protein
MHFLDYRYLSPLTSVRISKRENNLKIGPNNFLPDCSEIGKDRNGAGLPHFCSKNAGNWFIVQCTCNTAARHASTLSNIGQKKLSNYRAALLVFF